MFKKTMTFDDLDGNEVSETFYFNYNKKEIAELLEFGYLTDFPPADTNRRMRLEQQMEMLQTPIEESGLTEQQNTKMAYDIFQDLILDAFGEPYENRRGFDKSEKLRNHFKHHVAFVELIWEFVGDPAIAATFIEHCLPPKMVAEAKEELKKEGHTGATIHEMVLEADRRQKDPATRIEPGLDAAREALGPNPEVEKAALSIVDGGAPATKIEDLSPDDILEMDAEAFDKLDIRELNKEQMMAAFRRKAQG